MAACSVCSDIKMKPGEVGPKCPTHQKLIDAGYAFFIEIENTTDPNLWDNFPANIKRTGNITTIYWGNDKLLNVVGEYGQLNYASPELCKKIQELITVH